MAKNFIEQVANVLGVEIGEKFRLRNVEKDEVLDGLYFFSKYSGVVREKIAVQGTVPSIINDVVVGKLEIVKLPWEPKSGECYYWPNVFRKDVSNDVWHGGTFDYALKALSMVYKTLEEAQECFAEDYEKLTGKKLEG